MSELNLSHINPLSLTPFPNNPKLHTKAQVESLAQSIKKFGWTQPIVCDESNIILIGHARREASILLGLESVPVIKRQGLTDSEKKALVIFDNSSTKETGFDDDSVLEAYKLFESSDFDYSILGLKLETLGTTNEVAREQDVSKLEEAHERFMNAEVKQIVVYCEEHEYEELLEDFNLAMEQAEVSTRAELLVAMIDQYRSNAQNASRD